MSEVINVLTRKTSLRKACKEISLADMEKLAESLAGLIEERNEEESKMAAAQEEKLAKLEALKSEMQSAGIDISDLLASMETVPKVKKVKSTVAPKYQVTDGEGNVHKWTGRGRTPKSFQAFFDKGNSKEDCLIK